MIYLNHGATFILDDLVVFVVQSVNHNPNLYLCCIFGHPIFIVFVFVLYFRPHPITETEGKLSTLQAITSTGQDLLPPIIWIL